MTQRQKQHSVALTLTTPENDLLERVAKNAGLPKTRAILQAISMLDEVQSSRKLLLDPAIVGNIELRSKPQS